MKPQTAATDVSVHALGQRLGGRASGVRALAELLGSPVIGRLWLARKTSTLGQLLAARREVWQLLHSPFLHAKWRAKERLERLIDHCAIVDQIGPPFNLPLDHYGDLLEMVEIGADYRLKLDNPNWILRDGLLTLSLWEEPDRLFSLHFLFGYEDGQTVAYIGGIQGRPPGDRVRDQYRTFTKAAADIHPVSMLVEMFRAMCAEIGIHRILAVSNASRHQRSRYFTRRARYVDPVALDYDRLWEERSGWPVGDMYELPVILPERPESTVPRSKRARHRARRHLLNQLQRRLHNVLLRMENVTVAPHRSNDGADRPVEVED